MGLAGKEASSLRMRSFLFCLFMAGCSTYPELGIPNHHYLNPQEELVEYVRMAAARWTSTVGIPIDISETGVPVYIADGPVDCRPADKILAKPKDHYWALGCTTIQIPIHGPPYIVSVVIAEEVIDKGPVAMLNILTHEIGHVISYSGHREDHHGVMNTSFKQVILLQSITNEDLKFICQRVNCSRYKSEEK